MRLMVVVVGYRVENACVFFTIFIINKFFLSSFGGCIEYCKCKGLFGFNYSSFPSQARGAWVNWKG